MTYFCGMSLEGSECDLLLRHVLGGERRPNELHHLGQVFIDAVVDGDSEETDRLEGGRPLAVTAQATQQVQHRLIEVTATNLFT